MALKLCIGIVSASLSSVAILLNLLIFIPVFRLAFVSRRSTVYIIAFFNIITDIIQLGFICFNLCTSIIVDNYVRSEEQSDAAGIFLGFLFMNAWYMECLIQIVMAVNRFVVITLHQANLFTFNTTMLVFAVLLPTTLLSAASGQFIFPCCTFIWDHELLSFTYVETDGAYSYTNFMLLCFNGSSTATSIVCYTLVFNTIRSHNKETASMSTKSSGNRQDVRYLLQFVFISIFYDFTWILFEILPYLVSPDQRQWYAIVPIMAAFNCSSNSVIYLIVNREVQKVVKIPWLRGKLTRADTSRVVHVAAAPVAN